MLKSQKKIVFICTNKARLFPTFFFKTVTMDKAVSKGLEKFAFFAFFAMTMIDITLKSDLSVERVSRRLVSLARHKD